jgi:site-specific DNA-cytosine methylase
MKIFEFFSGIGGMHQAVINNRTLIGDYAIFPFDVNLTANELYRYNFGIEPDTLSLEYLKLDYYEKLCGVNCGNIMWVMSPPCQPFSCQGKLLDLNDPRSDAFKNLIEILNSNSKYLPNFILLENVKNFEVGYLLINYGLLAILSSSFISQYFKEDKLQCFRILNLPRSNWDSK